MDCREAGDMTLSRFFRKTPGSSGVFRRCGLSLLLYAALTAGGPGEGLLCKVSLPAPV